MILIINTCDKLLHSLEFVKPIVDILERKKINYFAKHYTELDSNVAKNADKIIICGTGLKDNEFMDHYERFGWIKDYDKPLLGICAGMHIIANVFGSKSVRCRQIGVNKIKLKENMLTDKEEMEVYELHNYSVKLPKDFINLGKDKCMQMIKHKKKKVYGVMFHPEVLNKEIIENFSSFQP